MIWDAVRYGWTPIYYLTIEGLPVIWTEAALGLTLPTGYTTESASLSLDAAAFGTEQIDRQRGVSMSAPLNFKILDSTTAWAYLSRWNLETRITAQADYNDATITVDDTTGWPASGSLYIGRELVTYTGKGATSFTGCTRGVCGLAYTHEPGTSGQTVTDRPRYWLGRQVTLWAKPCDASGAVPGTALATDAVEVWRGRIASQPSRQRDGFAFTAEQLDRLLDAPLAAKVTGTVKTVGGYYTVDTGAVAVFNISLADAAGLWTNYTATLDIWAGSGKASGDAVTGAETRAQVATAWSAWVIGNSLAAVFGALTWWKNLSGLWAAGIVVKNNVAVEAIDVNTEKPFFGASVPASMPSGMTADMSCFTGWEVPDYPFDQDGTSTGIVAELDDALAADIVAPGILRVTVGKQMFAFAYDFVAAFGANVYFGTSGKSAFPFTLAGVVGASCEIAQDYNGDVGDLMLSALQSSGIAGLRGTYDTFAQGSGYGIDSGIISESDFETDPTVQFYSACEADGGSFADIFGGALALFRRAVVGRVDGGAWKLRLVSTAPGGTDNADAVADTDLLAHDADPVESVDRAMAPNSVTVRLTTQDSDIVSVYNSNADIEATGRREAEYSIRSLIPSEIKDSAATLVLGLFAADQTAQAIKIRVGPWIAAQPGDVVYLDLNHPALWDWVTATQGFTGTGRVVGRMFDPVSLRVTLTILIGGSISTASLCPSAEILGYDGTAAAPTTLYLDGKYLSVMQKVVPCEVLHYRAGQAESAGERYTISAATLNSGQCELTVILPITGVHSISLGASYITWPTSAIDTTTQARFTHADDGTSWG